MCRLRYCRPFGSIIAVLARDWHLLLDRQDAQAWVSRWERPDLEQEVQALCG